MRSRLKEEFHGFVREAVIPGVAIWLAGTVALAVGVILSAFNVPWPFVACCCLAALFTKSPAQVILSGLAGNYLYQHSGHHTHN